MENMSVCQGITEEKTTPMDIPNNTFTKTWIGKYTYQQL